MIKTNDVGRANGELAAWIDGALFLHYVDFRWRADAAVLLKRFGLDIYVHKAARTNEAWYDDVVLSIGYVGPLK
jgi:hypothetical protein